MILGMWSLLDKMGCAVIGNFQKHQFHLILTMYWRATCGHEKKVCLEWKISIGSTTWNNNVSIHQIPATPTKSSNMSLAENFPFPPCQASWQVLLFIGYIPLCYIVTARKWSLGQGNIFISVCQEFCPQGGVCLSACLDTTPLPGPPGTRHPPEQATLWSRHPTPGTRYPHHPLAGTPRPGTPPPGAEHARRYGQQATGAHPTGMQSCYLFF